MAKYVWNHDGRMYFLQPEYKQSSTGRVWITGAGIYDKDDNYLGFWYRENMPHTLIHSLTKYVKSIIVSTPVSSHTVRGYTRRNPKR